MEQIQTSSKETTIWRPLDEKTFFINVREVARSSGGVPGPFMPFKIPSPPANYTQTLSDWLSLEVEHQLVNDLAFLAAACEGALSVSALTVSKNPPLGMVIMVAANSGISKEVLSSLQAICQELQRRARNDVDRQTCIDALFDIIIKLHENRIHGRIESIYWKPPPHIKSRPDQAFCDIFYASMCTFIDKSRKSSKDDVFEILRASERLHDSMRSVTQAHDISGLKEIARRAHQLSGTHPSFAAYLVAAGHADIAEKKLVRKVDKLGRYLKCCERLARMASSKRYKHCFSEIQIVPLNPFEPRIVLGSKRHIHAEIQLITYFTLHPAIPGPRVIGISKATCYLCNLFLSHYPQYLVSATHGAIFEHWSIPDLAAYTTVDRLKLRAIISAIDRALTEQARKKSKFMPAAQSGIWHDPCQLSTSSRTTVSSLVSNQTVRGAATPDIAGGKGARSGLFSEHAESVLDQRMSLNQDLPLCTSSDSYLKPLQPTSLAEHVPPSEVVLETSPGALTLQKLNTPDLARTPTAVMQYRHAVSTTPELEYVLENIRAPKRRVLELGGLRLCFEVEIGHNDNTTITENISSTAPDMVGRATIQKASNMGSSNDFEVIDLHSMVPGVDVMLQKHDTSKALGFVLRNGNQGALQISCQWSSSKG